MPYRNWDDNKELQCLVIFKYLKENNFPRGKQMELSKKLSYITNLSYGSISAKVSNFKSIAKINNSSNASNNSKRVYSKYINMELVELYTISNFYI